MLPTAELADLIRRKHDVLERLCDVGLRQQELVQRGDTAMLLHLLATKQSMINVLQDVERRLEPFRAEDPEARRWPTPAARAACARQAADCNRLLNRLVELERECADEMAARRNEVGSQLKQLHTARDARDAYAANRQSSPSRGWSLTE